MTTNDPPRIVAVAPGGSKRGYAYMVAAVYDLHPRKDATLTYRRSDTNYAWPHRSVRLATEDAKETRGATGRPALEERSTAHDRRTCPRFTQRTQGE